jgi:hypothetical protein
VKHPPRFIGTNVAPGDFAKLLLGADSELIKTGPGWGEQPGPAGLTTVKGRFGGFVLSPQPKKGALRADGQSPQTIATTEEDVSERMIPDSEVGLGDWGLVTIGGALGLLERRLCSGTANRSDGNHRKSDGHRGPNEQLRDAAWHDSLHPCQLHGGQSSSRKILTPVTDVTGSDDISDAYFARDFGGLGHAGPHRHQDRRPQVETCLLGPPTAAMGSFIPLGRAEIRQAASRVVSVDRICSGVVVTTAHTRGAMPVGRGRSKWILQIRCASMQR